jgi:tartrate dehydratase alpha subunit/fumarate hydratase class I-like protein
MYTVRHGGLFRCCLATLEEEYDDKHPDSFHVGEILTCKYCKKPTMVLAKDGVWEWNRKDDTDYLKTK